jgi:hypothetical protein
VTITQVAFYDGATLIGTDTTAPYTFTWNNVATGTHSITAKASINLFDGVVSSLPVDVVVGGTLIANFTPANGATFNVCDTITFTSTSTGTITGYSWQVDGTVIPFPTSTLTISLSPGIHSITLGISNAAGEVAQVTQTVTVVNNNPTAIPGGPYTVSAGGSLTLNGSGTDLDACNASFSYAWDVDNKGGYDYFTANPSMPYNAMLSVMGPGKRTMTFRVTDSSGGVGTATATVMIVYEAAVRMNSIIYPTLQSAYNNPAANNSVIEVTAGIASGGLVADQPKTVTISGGFGIGFTPATGVTSIRNPVTLKQGRVNVRSIAAMP